MQALFSPAILLMNRLRYPGKFLLLGLAAGGVMLLLLFNVLVNLNGQIATSQHELDGLQMLKPTNRMVQFMQQHRGLSSGVLNGNEAMKDKREAKEKEVADAVNAVSAAISANLRQSVRWKQISDDWADIQAHGMSWAPPENIKRHTQMISKALVFMIDIADETALTLDPVMDTYYFMDTLVTKMPAVLEPLGITRARGTGVLSKKELTPQMRLDMVSLIAQMSGTLNAQNNNLEKVVRYAPSLQPALAGPTKEFSDGVEKIFTLVREDILGEKFTTDPKDYFALTTQVIDIGYKVMFDVLMPQFEQQLQLRINRARNELYFDLVLSLGIMALVAYLAVATYFSVTNSITVFSPRGASSGQR